MRRFTLSVLLSILLCSFARADDRHVIIITMDGFAADRFRDIRTPIPTIRQLAAEGASAEGMRVANPSVTWPNHTTLVTGVMPAKHSVLFNGLLVRGEAGKAVRIDPARDQSELVAAPTIWDVAHKAGRSTAGINWPCTRNSPALDDNFPDVADQIDQITPTLKQELLKAKILPGGSQFDWYRQSAPQQDHIWTQAACWVIRHRKPNLMVLHMLLSDTVQHQYGPQTLAAFATMAVLDSQLRDLLAALEDAVIRDKTTIFITADHGFARYVKLIQPNVLLSKEGYQKPGQMQVQVVAEGGCAFVYFNDRKSAAELEPKIAELFKGHEGIADVITSDRFAGFGLPTPDKNPRMGSILLAAKDGYSFGPANTGNEIVETAPGSNVGSHGYINTNPKMYATFVAFGRGIKKGVKLGVIQNTSVAPTAAKLLGLEIPGADGSVLSDILEEQR